MWNGRERSNYYRCVCALIVRMSIQGLSKKKCDESLDWLCNEKKSIAEIKNEEVNF